MKLQQVKEQIERYGVGNMNDEALVFGLTGIEANLKTSNEDFYKIVASCKSAKEISIKTGLTIGQATKVLLAIEIGKRFCTAQAYERICFDNPQTIADYLMPMLKNLQQEHFVVLCLNGRRKLVKKSIISQGTLSNTLVHAREVFKEAIVNNSACIVVAHNHPTGNAEPSQDDKEITRMLVRSGNVLGIPVLDHIIIGNGTYYSFKEYELID